MKIEQFKETIKKLISDDDKPVVVFAAMWSFMKAWDIPAQDIPHRMLNVLMETVGEKRSLVMPTETSGYKNGTFNLDEEPSQTGILSELFRKRPLTRRSLSAFFSHVISGPDTEELVSLQPEFAWGEGSVYEWMELKNVHFLMLGTHPTHCSYLHRMEWLNREHINYRYNKKFEGTLLREGKSFPIQETLYVRSLNPPVVNDFTVIYDDLKQGGMTVKMLDGVHVAHMRAIDMKEAYLPLLKKDPFLTVKNRADFERKSYV